MATTIRPSLVMVSSPRMSLRPPHKFSEDASGICNNVHCGKTNQVDTLQKTTEQMPSINYIEGGTAVPVATVNVTILMLLLMSFAITVFSTTTMFYMFYSAAGGASAI